MDPACGVTYTVKQLREMYPQVFSPGAILIARKNKTLPLLSKQWLADVSKGRKKPFASAHAYLAFLDRGNKNAKRRKNQRSETLELSEEEDDDDCDGAGQDDSDGLEVVESGETQCSGNEVSFILKAPSSPSPSSSSSSTSSSSTSSSSSVFPPFPPLQPGMGLIYKLTCMGTGQIYIGQTRLPFRIRLRAHVRWSKTPPQGHRLYQAMHDNDFMVDIIEYCKITELDEREIFWIAHHKTTDPECGYNLTSGGGHPVFSQEAKDRISVANRQRNDNRFTNWPHLRLPTGVRRSPMRGHEGFIYTHSNGSKKTFLFPGLTAAENFSLLDAFLKWLKTYQRKQ